MLTVSNSHVEEMLKTSGNRGIIVDLNSKECDEAYDFAWIRMPSDMKMLDAMKKIEALPHNLRKGARGVIPSFWGIAYESRDKQNRKSRGSLTRRKPRTWGQHWE